jgi:hypothetical protein
MAFEEVWFNGKALSSVTPHIEQARLLTFNPQQVGNAVSAVDPPLRHGKIFTRAKFGPRTIILSIVLGSIAYQQRFDDFMALCAWAYSSEPKQLTATHMRHYYFEAICTSIPEFKGNEPSAAYEFEFTALKPEYIGQTLRSADYDEDIVVGGVLDTWIDYELTLAAPASSVEVTVDGKTITITGSIPAGTINIYSETERVMHTNGSGEESSLAEMLAYTSEFWKVSPGTYTPTASAGTFTWRERLI